MPSPVSRTIRSAPSSSTRQISETASSGSVCRSAFESKLFTTDSMSAASPDSRYDRSASITISACTSDGGTVLLARSKIAPMSTRSEVSVRLELSRCDSSRSPSMIPFMRTACSCMSRTGLARCSASSGSSTILSRYPLITVSGERNSCEALAASSLRIRLRVTRSVTSRISSSF